MFEGFERKKIDTGDAIINCVVGGSGPPVLMLHGYPQNLAMWARVAPALAEKFTIVCGDLRGYGDSSKPHDLPDHANYSFRAMAGDQAAVMKQLGFERYHVIGHDRGGRTGHRLALDRPDRVLSLTVMDIVPTHAMFNEVSRDVAMAYWHWYFLAQPEPFPERLIGADPDFYYESSFPGRGAARLPEVDEEMLAEYRRCWRDPAMIHASCSDYRAAATIDLTHDNADIDRKVECPVLVFFGEKGAMNQLFDIPATWRRRCANVTAASLPGGHFFVDQFPAETAAILRNFLGG